MNDKKIENYYITRNSDGALMTKDISLCDAIWYVGHFPDSRIYYNTSELPTANAYFEVTFNQDTRQIVIEDTSRCVVISDTNDILAIKNHFGTLTIFVRSDIIESGHYRLFINNWYDHVYINDDPNSSIPVLEISKIISGKLDKHILEWIEQGGEY